MGMDIRLPIGLLFSLLGVFLTGYGLFGDKSIYAKSLDINVNLVWGIVMIVFGAFMIGLAARAKSKHIPSAASPASDTTRGSGH